MEKYLEFTLEGAFSAGDKLGYDLSFRIDFVGTNTINGVQTLFPVSPAIIKPKFDKQSNMAIKRPAKIYDLQPSAIAGGYAYAVCHIHVIELDKIGDYGDAAVLPIELYVNHIEEKPTM